VDTDRLPPQDLEAERAVLGSVLLDNAKLSIVALTGDDFYSPDHRAIYEGMRALAERGEKIDLVTLCNALREAGTFEQVGGSVELVSILERTPSPANAEFYAAIIIERAQRRRLIHLATEVSCGAFDLTVPLPDTLVLAQEGLAGIHDAEVDEADDLEAIGQRALAELSGHSAGMRWNTEIPWLDALTGGMGRNQGWIICGKSGHCKTAFALNIALGILKQAGTVCFFRWEERLEAMALKLAGLTSGIPYAEVARRATSLNPQDVERFKVELAGVTRRYRSQLFIYRGLDLGGVENAVVKHDPWLCVYDTLQAAAMQMPNAANPRRHDLHVQSICGAITRLRGQRGHTSLIISQLSGEGHERESRAIREDNDVSIDVFWPCKDDREIEDDKLIARFRKNRLGGVEPAVVCVIDPGTQAIGRSLPSDEEREFLNRTGG